jgi:hypothetical protein
MTSAITDKRSTEQKVLAALGAAKEATVDQVAAEAAIGRTSARKYLAALEQTGAVKRAPGGREGKRKLPDRYSPAREEGGPPPPTSARRDGSPDRRGPAADRLQPGGLDALVLGYMREHGDDGPFGPSAVAKGLGRSSGAVGNCLVRLADADGEVELVDAKPRRYALKG